MPPLGLESLHVLEAVGDPAPDLEIAGPWPSHRQRSRVRGLIRQRRAKSSWVRCRRPRRRLVGSDAAAVGWSIVSPHRRARTAPGDLSMHMRFGFARFGGLRCSGGAVRYWAEQFAAARPALVGPPRRMARNASRGMSLDEMLARPRRGTRGSIGGGSPFGQAVPRAIATRPALISPSVSSASAAPARRLSAAPFRAATPPQRARSGRVDADFTRCCVCISFQCVRGTSNVATCARHGGNRMLHVQWRLYGRGRA